MANDYALLVSASEKHTKVQDFCKILKVLCCLGSRKVTSWCNTYVNLPICNLPTYMSHMTNVAPH